jgi:tRNA 2-thiocytidine biosynthesis protein TtcA
VKDIEKQIGKKINQAIVKYKMIEEGDRILVAVSGGKDSMSLIYHLNKKANSRFHMNFEIHGIHIKTDFCNCGGKTRFEKFLTEMAIPYSTVHVPVLARLKPGRKMNCYWCSSQRRMELMKFATENGYNKIALGHHMDDILETFFMNMAYKGELSTMLPLLKYDNYEQTLIRPLALVKEKEIIDFASMKKITNLTCTCPYGHKSKRKDMRAVINFMDEGDDSIRDKIYKALSNPIPRYMIDNDED